MLTTMKIALQLCAGLMIVGTAFGQTKPKDVDGWNNIKWGTSVADAKVALGDQASEPATEPNPRATLTEKLVIKSLLVGDSQFRGSIFSKKGSDAVASVTIYAKEIRGPSLSRDLIFDSLKTLLIQKYGQPNSEDRRTTRRDVDSIVVWVFPSTTISLRRSESLEGGLGSVLVNYSAMEKTLDIL